MLTSRLIVKAISSRRPFISQGIPMKIALIGATGFVGSAVLAEALQRDHQVTALVRDPLKLAARPQLQVVRVDATDATAVADAAAGHDALVSAYNGPRGAP